MAGTITISSSYGALGDPIGREVARRLGVEFFDRLIPIAVARELAVEPEEAIAKDWQAPGRMDRMLAALASISIPDMGAGVRRGPSANPDASARPRSPCCARSPTVEEG